MKKVKYLLISWLISTFFCVSLYAQANANEYHLLVLSDIHLGNQKPMELAPKNFNPNNDLDNETFQLLLSNMQQLITSKQIMPQSGLVLGDLVDHISSNKDKGSTEARIKQLSSSFKALGQWALQIDLPLSYVFGNNDSLLGDYNVFYMKDNSQHSPYVIAQSNGWQGGFTTQRNDCANTQTYPCTVAEDQMNGHYVEYLAPKLKLIIMNTVSFNNRATCGGVCQGELDWLAAQLQDPNGEHDSILIAMHLPPGMDTNKSTLFWQENVFKQFIQIIQLHANRIIAILTAHTHMEEMQMIKISQDRVIPVIYTAGLSTSHGNVPAFKYLVFQYDQDKWTLKNYQTYSFNDQYFNLYYDFQSTYCGNAPIISIEACLNNYLKTNQLKMLLDMINARYTAGNKNFQLNMKDTNPNDLVMIPSLF